VRAFGNNPLTTGMLRCRGTRGKPCPCSRPQPVSAFEPRADSVYGIRRQCRDCRQPTKRRYETKRPRLRLERLIASVEGPELEALGREVLDSKKLRFIQALACRLRAGTYELDTKGRPIIPPTLKAWADRLGYHRAEVFCRRELGLPDLPAQKRHFVNRNPIWHFFALLREQRQKEQAQRWAEKNAGWAESRQIKKENHPPRRAERWNPYRPTEPRRTIEELYIEHVMSQPRPDGTLATETEPWWRTQQAAAASPSQPKSDELPSMPFVDVADAGNGTQTLEDVRGEAVCSNPPLALRPPIADASTRKGALSFPQYWGPAPGSPEDTAALKAAGRDPYPTVPTPEPSHQAERDVRPRTKDEVRAALAAGKINPSLAEFLLDSIDLSTGPGRQLRGR
jgi:hypothetical protein